MFSNCLYTVEACCIVSFEKKTIFGKGTLTYMFTSDQRAIKNRLNKLINLF